MTFNVNMLLILNNNIGDYKTHTITYAYPRGQQSFCKELHTVNVTYFLCFVLICYKCKNVNVK